MVLRCRQTVRSGRDAAMELVTTEPDTTAERPGKVEPLPPLDHLVEGINTTAFAPGAGLT